MTSGEIGPVGRTSFGGGYSAGAWGGAAGADEEAPRHRRRRRLDRVVLTRPGTVALNLLRERVLEATRQHLELPRVRGAAGFTPSLGDEAEVYVGRLLSEQNVLAAQRRGDWSEDRVAAAVEAGMNDGLGETLDILHELGELDTATWQLVCGVLEEFQRKVASAGAG